MAAQLRRQAAESERHTHGDIAYQRFRSADPAGGKAHRGGRVPRELRAKKEMRGDKELFHTSGYFTRYGRPYPMWDSFGEYRERVRVGAGARTLAAKPEVAFLTNHGGMAMARTTTGTLELREDQAGGWHDGWLNPARSDVNDLVIAIDDGDVPQMSFAFMIPDGQGEWSADFAEFEIIEYDIDGGDVSACNFGANPYTDITARTPDVLDDLGRLPQGALWEARRRLEQRDDSRAREQITVRHATREVDAGASPMRRRLQGKISRTAARFADLANRAGLTVEDLATARLPWYEIRAAADPLLDPVEDGTVQELAEPESTDIYVFDEIGGSFGVDAKTFAEDLNAITTPRINLHINSPGGSVTEGMAIRSALMHHPSWITANVDGIAASAASIIALGADDIVTMPGAQWMLHDASTHVEGNQAELGKATTWIGRQSDNLAEIYAERMGITAEEARGLMLAETWAFAEESVEMGLADRVGERSKAKTPPADLAERMARSHDLTRFGYRYTSRMAAPAPLLTRTKAGYEVALNSTVPPDTAGRGEVTAPNGSTPHQPQGRSIALIEAQLDLDEHTSR